MKNRILSLVLSLLIVMTMVPAAALAADDGTCGDNLTWALSDDGVLTISGTGAMDDFESGAAPWAEYAASVMDIVIEDGVQSIGNSAFEGCEIAESVTIGSDVAAIGDFAFYGCASFENLTLPNGIATIGESAFEGCYTIGNLVIPDSVTTLGNNAFSGCGAIESLTIGSGLTTISGGTFLGCYSIQNVTVGANVTDIADYAFDGCDALTDVTFFGTEEQWNAVAIGEGNDALLNANVDFAPEVEPAGNSCGDNATWELSDDGVLTISGTGAMYDYGFYDEKPWVEEVNNITRIVIEDGITHIGAYAFSYCKATSVSIADSVESMGERAFYACVRLIELTIPGSIETIENTAFYGCIDLVKLTIQSGVTTIGEYAFYGCYSIKEISMPSSVTTIGNSAFEDCEAITNVEYLGTNSQWEAISIGENNEYLTRAVIGYGGEVGDNNNITWSLGSDGVLRINGTGAMPDYSLTNPAPWCDYELKVMMKSIEIGEGITHIGNTSFDNCVLVTSVSLPSTLETIGNSAFYDCLRLESIEIPYGVTHIGNGAFAEAGLKSIVIPNSVVYLGGSAFARCTDLESVTLSSGLTTIEKFTFTNCKSLVEVNIPTGITAIDESVFNECTSLKHITIPEGVTVIEKSTFSYCRLSTLTLPLSLETIEAYAFEYGGAENVFYPGTRAQRDEIDIRSYWLVEQGFSERAIWHYEVEVVEFCDGECFYCPTCDKYHNFDGTERVHIYEYVSNNDATPESDGTKLGTCTRCGDTITVTDEGTKLNPIGLEITALPAKLQYFGKKEYIDVTGGKIMLHYEGGITREKDMTADMIYDFNNAVAGTQTVTVKVNDLTDTFEVEITTATVVFKNWDGTVLSSAEYLFGDRVKVPEQPTKPADDTYVYIFDGWDKYVSNCAGDEVYTAVFRAESKTYTIVFKNWDGSVLSETIYFYGDEIVAPAAPERPSDSTYDYTFAGWDSEIEVCTGDKVYTAQFTAESRLEGWQQIDGKWYYYVSGVAQTGWQKVDGKWYYMDANGVMQTGWQKVSGKWYYLKSEMKTGWQQISGKWYYLGYDGAMQTGWQKISSKWYYLGSDGAMKTGWQKIDNKWYYLNSEMKTGWQKVSGKWYYLNNEMKTGWQQIGGKWYYLGTDGAMTTGWQKVSNKWYYMNSSGVMQTGWLTINGSTYYLNASGVMVTGTQVIGGKTYKFSSGGVLMS